MREIIRNPDGEEIILEYDERGNTIAGTDVLGNTTRYTHDLEGNVLSKTNPLGDTTTYTYNIRRDPLSETSPLNETYFKSFNAFGDLLSATDPLGNSFKFIYDGFGNLLSSTDPLGNVTTFAYDGRGNLISETDPLGNVTIHTYNEFGDRTSTMDALGNSITFTYDENGNLLTQSRQRTLGDGTISEITLQIQYDALNQPIAIIDPDGNTATTEYDANGNIIRLTNTQGIVIQVNRTSRGQVDQVVYPDGTTNQYRYDLRGNAIRFTDRNNLTTTNEYDALGQLVRKTSPDGAIVEYSRNAVGFATEITDSKGTIHQFEQDANGRLIRTTRSDNFVNQFAYDKASNLLSAIDFEGRETRGEFDELGRKRKTIFPDGSEIKVEYDALGQVIGQVDPSGRETKFDYDPLGRLKSLTDPLGNLTQYGYDEVGNLISITDANRRVTTYEYDNFGRRTKRTLPLGMFETWTYDKAGNLSGYTDFNGNEITYFYNNNNLLIEAISESGETQTFTYTPQGHLNTISEEAGTTTFDYDEAGRLLQVINPNNQTLTYTYDSSGNRQSIQTAAGTTSYEYDELGRIVSVIDPDAQITQYSYDESGTFVKINYPNGTETKVAFDQLNQAVLVENRNLDTEILSSYSYKFTEAGMIKEEEEDSGRIVTYEYDILDRVVREIINEPGVGIETLEYTYDPSGNRLTRTDGSGTTLYVYDENDRLLTDSTFAYTYDDNGNLVTRTGNGQTIVYRYDFQNRITKVIVDDGSGINEIDYEYSAGVRTAQTVNGLDKTNYLVDYNQLVEQVLLETDGDDQILTSYIYGNGRISQIRDGERSYFHHDAQGSIRFITDDLGQITDRYDYEAFGNIRNEMGSTSNNWLAFGEMLDFNSGLYYLRARHYDPTLGRFISRDPEDGTIERPATFYPYVYAENNPINLADPTGRFSVSQTVAGLAIGAAISNFTFVKFGTHPLLIGTERDEVNAENPNTPGGSGRWWQFSSSFDFGLGGTSFSLQHTVSKSLSLPVGSLHEEVVMAASIDLWKVKATQGNLGLRSFFKVPRGARKFIGKESIKTVGRNLGTGTTLTNSFLLGGIVGDFALASGFLQLGAAEKPLDTRLVSSIITVALGSAGYFINDLNVELGVSVGLGIVFNSYTTGQLDGLAAGPFGGFQGQLLGFDIGFDVGINGPRDILRTGTLLHGGLTFSGSLSATLNLPTDADRTGKFGLLVYYALRVQRTDRFFF